MSVGTRALKTLVLYHFPHLIALDAMLLRKLAEIDKEKFISETFSFKLIQLILIVRFLRLNWKLFLLNRRKMFIMHAKSCCGSLLMYVRVGLLIKNFVRCLTWNSRRDYFKKS